MIVSSPAGRERLPIKIAVRSGEGAHAGARGGGGRQASLGAEHLLSYSPQSEMAEGSHEVMMQAASDKRSSTCAANGRSPFEAGISLSLMAGGVYAR